MKISVVVPAYNEEAVIERCLDALVNQIVPVDEILVVDNNSTDRTAEIAEKYRGYGVRVIREPVQGLIPARNRGFDEATGDILGRIDADTVVEPDWSQRLAEAFADPTVSAATGPLLVLRCAAAGVSAWRPNGCCATGSTGYSLVIPCCGVPTWR